MVGTIVIRAMLVIALIATAHIIKPFSIKSVAEQLAATTHTLSFVLPDETRSGFNHVNFLAISLSRSLFGGECFEGGRSADVLAANFTGTSLKSPARVWPPEEFGKSGVKSGRRAKPAPRQSAPSKRIERPEGNYIAVLDDKEYSFETEDLATSDADLTEAETAPTPVALPVLPAEATSAFRVRQAMVFMGGNSALCYQFQPKSMGMMAMLVAPKKRPLEVKTILQMVTTSARKCDGQTPDGSKPGELGDSDEPELEMIVEEAPVADDSAPQEEQPPVPQETTEESKPEFRVTPLQCPADPQ